MPNGEYHDLTDREILVTIAEKIKVLPDHEERLRSLETTKNYLWGAWLVVSAWLGIHSSIGHK